MFVWTTVGDWLISCFNKSIYHFKNIFLLLLRLWRVGCPLPCVHPLSYFSGWTGNRPALLWLFVSERSSYSIDRPQQSVRTFLLATALSKWICMRWWKQKTAENSFTSHHLITTSLSYSQCQIVLISVLYHASVIQFMTSCYVCPHTVISCIHKYLFCLTIFVLLMTTGWWCSERGNRLHCNIPSHHISGRGRRRGWLFTF